MTDQKQAVFTVTNPEQNPFTLRLSGRNCWAMEQLVSAGGEGCTPVDNPAPRWSAYIYNLRQVGVSVKTITERHGGGFPGKHGRYVLRARVTPHQEGGAQ